MATWPTTLPQLPQSRGYSEDVDYGRLDFKPSTGDTKSRRRYSRETLRLSFNLLLTDSQVTILLDFFSNDLNEGITKFDWKHPRTQEVADFMFAEKPSIRNIGYNKYIASINLYTPEQKIIWVTEDGDAIIDFDFSKILTE